MTQSLHLINHAQHIHPSGYFFVLLLVSSFSSLLVCNVFVTFFICNQKPISTKSSLYAILLNRCIYTQRIHFSHFLVTATIYKSYLVLAPKVKCLRRSIPNDLLRLDEREFLCMSEKRASYWP